MNMKKVLVQFNAMFSGEIYVNVPNDLTTDEEYLLEALNEKSTKDLMKACSSDLDLMLV